MKQDRSVSRIDEAPVMQAVESLPPPGHAYYLEELPWFARNTDVTASVRIRTWRIVHDRLAEAAKYQGFRVFDVDADMIESFHGTAPGSMTFQVFLPVPDTPPRDGVYIVSLDKVSGTKFFVPDSSIPWTRPTPALLHTLRSMR